MIKHDVNPCYGCDCYDEDMGCTMSSLDKGYACPLNDEQEVEMTEFFMAMEPPNVPAQEHKVTVVNGKQVFYDPPEIKAANEKLIGHLYKNRIMEPYRSGIRLFTKWCFPRGRHRDGEYRITKPDTDNLQKLLKDCMTLVGFWEDDALVASEVTEKFWAEKPGIYIRIEEL